VCVFVCAVCKCIECVFVSGCVAVSINVSVSVCLHAILQGATRMQQGAILTIPTREMARMGARTHTYTHMHSRNVGTCLCAHVPS